MKRLTILITMLMATSGWAFNETDLMKFKAINECNSCDLSFAKLGDATKFGKDLRYANLSGANLTNASFGGANLRDANLSGADLRYANLSGADLTRASFNGAKLSDADLSGADLTGANFTGASLTNVKLDEVIYCNTTMPWGVLNDGCKADE